MQTHTTGNDRSSLPGISLQQETDGLEALHRRWAQQVAAWRLAHEAAVGSATSILARIDALIGRLEAR
jgi:hypothetical protein